MTLETAVAVFLEANAPAVGVANPRVRRQVDGLWIEHDLRVTKNPRKINVTVINKTPAQVLATVRAEQLGWQFISHTHTEADFDAIRAEYKAAGYRPLSSFGIFTHDLASIPDFTSDPPPQLVPDELVDTLFGTRHPPRKTGRDLYAVWSGDELYGAVTDVLTSEYGYVSDLHVKPAYRGHGMGKALMSSLLKGTKARGLKGSILLSSVAGELVYPKLGYEKIGVMQVFCPPKRK